MLLYAETTIEVSHRVFSPVAEREQIHGHSYWIRIYVLTDTNKPVPVEKLKKDLIRWKYLEYLDVFIHVAFYQHLKASCVILLEKQMKQK